MRVASIAETNCFFALASSASEIRPARIRFQFFKQGASRGCIIISIQRRADPEQPRIARAVGPGVGGMHDSLGFAHVLIEAGASPGPEHRCQHIQQRHVRVPEGGDMPGQVEIAQFDGSFLHDFARRNLRRFLGQVNRGHGAGLGGCVCRLDQVHDLLVLHIPGDDEENIVRRVFLAVVVADVLGLQLVEDIRDNR